MRTPWVKRITVTLLLLAFLCIGTVPALAAAPTNGKVVALTFDDGPNQKFTPQLLDKLAERNVKCTFFLVGQYVSLYPDVAVRIYEEGHQVASHTYSHADLTKLTNAGITQQIESNRSMLNEITGQDNFMLRLPYGYGNTSSPVLSLINAPVILWSVDPGYGRMGTSEESLYQGILNQVRDGSIIILHDTYQTNVNAAIRAIDTLTAQGWSFVTVEELFRIKGVQPVDNKVYYSVTGSGTAFNEAYLSSHWAYNSISYVMNNNLMVGTGLGFEPNQYLNRAMAASLLWRLSGRPDADSKPDFPDVPADEWYSVPAAWAQENGIVVGYEDGRFGPSDYVSREQFCVMLTRLAKHQGLVLPEGGTARPYSDAQRVSSWALAQVKAIWNAGFVSANDTSIFRPQDSMTRAECAELLAWYHNIMRSLGIEPPAPSKDEDSNSDGSQAPDSEDTENPENPDSDAPGGDAGIGTVPNPDGSNTPPQQETELPPPDSGTDANAQQEAPDATQGG